MNAKPLSRACLPVLLALLAVASLAGCDQTLNATPQSEPSPEAGGDLVCSSRRDCTYDIVPVVETEADCACPRCPVDVDAVPRGTYEQRAKTYSKVCGAWAQQHACPPTFCETPPKLACVSGECSLEGQKKVKP